MFADPAMPCPPPGMSIAVHTPVRSPADTRLAAVLRDYDSRVDQAPLPDEGIEKFVKAFDQLMNTLKEKRVAAIREPVDIDSRSGLI